MIGTAWAADAAHSESIFSDPAFWVAVAFFLFFALAGKALWGRISAMLDKRSADIAKALADAARLREEAMKAKQDAERTLENLVDVGRHRLDRPRPREQEHVLHGSVEAIDLPDDLARDLIASVVAVAFLGQDLAGTANPGQRVANLVRHLRGELADRGQTFLLA